MNIGRRAITFFLLVELVLHCKTGNAFDEDSPSIFDRIVDRELEVKEQSSRSEVSGLDTNPRGNANTDDKEAVVDNKEGKTDLLQLMLGGVARKDAENLQVKIQATDYLDRYCSECMKTCRGQENAVKVKCFIELQSYGLNDLPPWNGYIRVDGSTYWNVVYSGGVGYRGVNTMVLDPLTCTASFLNFFDTSGVPSSSADLADYLKYLSDGAILLGVTMDDAVNNLAPAFSTLKNAGIPVKDTPVRGKFAFVLVKGHPEKTIMAKAGSGGSVLKLNVRLEGTAENVKLVTI